MKTKPGMSSLNEDDVRRICREEQDISAKAILDSCATHINKTFAGILEEQTKGQIAVIEACGYKVIRQQATDTETPANQEASEVPAEEGTPPWQDRRVGDRRKRPEPKCYKG